MTILALLDHLPFQYDWTTPRGAVIAIVCIFLGAYWIRSLLFAVIDRLLPPTTTLPTVAKPAGHDFREAMREGKTKYPGKAWVIPFQDPTVILPLETLDTEIKKIPEPDLTLNGNMYKRFFGQYTQVGTDMHELVDALKFDLSQGVHGLLGVMAEEVTYGYGAVVGKPASWTPFPTYQTLLQIVALTSGRVFVGLPLSRTDEWVQASIQHTMGSVYFSDKLRSYLPLLRPLVAPFLRERKAVSAVQETVAQLLDPIISKKRPLSFSSSNGNGSLKAKRQTSSRQDEEEAGRMTSWLLGRYAKNAGEPPKPSRLVRDHLTLSFAAVHVASMALTHVLHDLAIRPEYMNMLRAELEAEMNKFRSKDGSVVLDSKSLANLVKMDSFIKESLRLNPSGIVAWTRLTTVPIHLANGQVIPKNTMVAYCNPRFDPSVDAFENPEEFDGLRFVKLAQSNGPQVRYKLDSLSTDSLGFGYGIHACPGRSFAVAELKLIVAHLIQNYDLKLKDGEGRPENIFMDFQIMPDPRAEVLLRARKV